MQVIHDNTVYTLNYTATERNTIDMGLLYNQQHLESYEQNWNKIEKVLIKGLNVFHFSSLRKLSSGHVTTRKVT